MSPWRFILTRQKLLSKKVCLVWLNSGQCRKKWYVNWVSPLQAQMRFIVSLKPCLNLRSLRWFIPIHNLVNNSIPYGLWISKIVLEENLINSKSLFWKYQYSQNFAFLVLVYQSNSQRGEIKIFQKVMFQFK